MKYVVCNINVFPVLLHCIVFFLTTCCCCCFFYLRCTDSNHNKNLSTMNNYRFFLLLCRTFLWVTSIHLKRNPCNLGICVMAEVFSLNRCVRIFKSNRDTPPTVCTPVLSWHTERPPPKCESNSKLELQLKLNIHRRLCCVVSLCHSATTHPTR